VNDVFQAAPLKVLVTGAAGQIAYSLLYSVAKGDVFGLDQVTQKHLIIRAIFREGKTSHQAF